MFPARHYQCSDNKWHLLLATILLSMWLSSATGEGAEAINGSLFAADAPKLLYVGTYGEPLSFRCESYTHRHAVLCLATKVVQPDVQPWSLACLESRYHAPKIDANFRIASLTEQYSGRWQCGLTRYAFYVPPPESKRDIYFEIAIKEVAPRNPRITVSATATKVLRQSSVSGFAQVLEVKNSPADNKSRIFYIRGWNPTSKIAIDIGCNSERAVYPRPQIEFTSPHLELDTRSLPSCTSRVENRVRLTSPTDIIPGTEVKCSSSNKVGSASSTALLKHGVEPLAFPMAHLQETVRHNSNSFVSHVYGAPLGDLNACIKIQGLSQNRTCTGRVSSDINMTKTIGDFGTATAHFSWSHGHVDRGNVFGKATWVLTQAADGSNLPQELFPRASFILRIRNSYFGRRAKKFVFTLDDIKENPHDHVRLQVADQSHWPPLSSLVTAKS